jgi:hypothetical protein
MLSDPQIKKQLLLYGVPLALGAAVLVGLGVYRAGLTDQVSTLESRLTALKGQSAQLSRSSESVSDLESKTKDFAVRMPSDVDKGRLLESISHELTSRDVTEIETQGQPGASGTDFSRFTFGLTFQAPFEKVYEIIEAIETKEQIIRVDQMEVRGRARETSDRVSVHMKLSAFASVADAEVSL